MLSRVADNLYWMSRYLERAEHTARLLGLTLTQTIEQTPDAAAPRWERMLAHTVEPPHDAYHISQALTFDASNDASIVGCIAAARDNARQVREMISSEMWEQLNRLYLRVRGTTMEQFWATEPYDFYQMVKEGAHLFQGITDGTLSHGEGWHFIQLGRNIERAGATARMLDVYFTQHFAANGEHGQALDYLDWVGLLKSCTAFEAYCKVYSADVKPEAIAEFLLLNPEFPRSVRFAADEVQGSLQAIARVNGTRNAGRAERLAGRLRSNLDYAQVDEILADNVHDYLAQVQRQCAEIHSAIYQVYISYPVETVLAQ
jgi:uncharacterized alpha-E superfamily protein